MDILKEKLHEILQDLLGELPISPDYVLDEIWKAIVEYFQNLYKS